MQTISDTVPCSLKIKWDLNLIVRIKIFSEWIENVTIETYQNIYMWRKNLNYVIINIHKWNHNSIILTKTAIVISDSSDQVQHFVHNCPKSVERQKKVAVNMIEMWFQFARLLLFLYYFIVTYYNKMFFYRRC